jgi:hypothetical protein
MEEKLFQSTVQGRAKLDPGIAGFCRGRQRSACGLEHFPEKWSTSFPKENMTTIEARGAFRFTHHAICSST